MNNNPVIGVANSITNDAGKILPVKQSNNDYTYSGY